MLQIPNSKLFGESMSYEAMVHQYLPDGIWADVDVSANRQSLIDMLNDQVENERFYFLVNTKTNLITHCNGVENWLGYDSKRFSIKKYIDIMHPAHAIVQGFYAIAMFRFLAEQFINEEQKKGMTYVTLIALRHKSGKYIYCKTESSLVQISSNGRILEYANVFTVIKDFNNEHFSIRIYDDKGQRKDIEEKIIQMIKQHFEKSTGFSTQELRILKRYASSENVTSETIANSFKIKKATISTYNKRILDKAENIFDYRFENAQKAAAYFNDMSLI